MVINGDCLEVMPTLDAESVDSIVTDPPYGLSFMGKDWDHGIPGVDFWRAALRVAKPGAHLLAFGGTRTFHRLTCAIEDAGWEIRDCIMWVYSQGFPKSLDVSKAIDKAAGAEREVVGGGNTKCEYLLRGEKCQGHKDKNGRYGETIHTDTTAPATPAAVQWNGWGTSIKPAWEPIIVARKPLCGTVAENVVKYGTGGMNIDGARVETKNKLERKQGNNKNTSTPNAPNNGWISKPQTLGRFPANLIHDGSAEAVMWFPETGPSKASMRGVQHSGRHGGYGDSGQNPKRGSDSIRGHNDFGGSAARFFYCAKASKADRDEGNHHPTVKPNALMRYLCRLVTPPSGLILDPFCGSGSTGKAAVMEGFRFIGIELDADYVRIAEARINAQQEGRLF